AAGEAVAGYLEVAGTRESGIARRQAAAALSRSWAVLAQYQPQTARRDNTLRPFRDANHGLHVLFADAMREAALGEHVAASAAATARAIGNRDTDPGAAAKGELGRPPLPAAPVMTRLVRAIEPRTQTRRVMVRVGLAAPLAGASAAMLGVGHVYWAMAAAVLILHQGANRLATLQRGSERLIGTFIGLGLAAVVLGLHPQGLWLVFVVFMLQFAIELFIVTNYALATVFITAIALTIATGSRPVDVTELVIDRGLDTAIGCAAGLMVYLLVARRQEVNRISDAIADMLGAATTATLFLARGEVSTLAARGARRDLQESILDLTAAEESARGGFRRDRVAATRLAPIVTAAEQLGYATVAACWAAEHSTEAIFGPAEAMPYIAVLQNLSEALHTGTNLAVTADLPPFAGPEVLALSDALARR
nr:FUSC family protein [Actinomycetes bacterium]